MIVFVFGSNLAGRHGRGAALDAARYWGAIRGKGQGWQGESYAIPTKDYDLKPLKLEYIALQVEQFLTEASHFPQYDFQVTRIGCGLAGFRDEEIAPLFRGATPNAHLPLGWRGLSQKLGYTSHP